MIRKFIAVALVVIGMASSACASMNSASSSASSQSGDFLSDLLGKVSNGIDVGKVVTDVIDGVFTKENLTVADIAGQWQSTGSAVSFRSENFLKNAGGSAITSAIESKLNPYYKKLSLDKAVITIEEDGTLTLNAGKYTLNGTIKVNDKKTYAGNFIVNFKALGIMSLGEYDTYVTMTSNPLTGAKELNIMFDAQKLVALMKAFASFSKSSVASGVTSLVDSYDGVCVGFQCKPYTK